jgi:hypothetical protein
VIANASVAPKVELALADTGILYVEDGAQIYGIEGNGDYYCTSINERRSRNKVEVDLLSGTEVLDTRVVDFHDETTIN